MLFTKLFSSTPKVDVDRQNSPKPDYEPSHGRDTQAGERVTVENALSVATAYRAKNIISDDVAKMPLQVMRREGNVVKQVEPDPVTRNLAYLVEISPNLWGWTPFLFKKAVIEWLLFYGNAYVWSPVVGDRQLLILPANRTVPVFALDGSLWYQHTFSNSVQPQFIPAVEILHLLINPDQTGFVGRGVITYARETFGRQLGAYKAQSKFYAQGMMPAASVKWNGELDAEGRERVRQMYSKGMESSENAYRLAVFDNKVTEFKPIEMQLRDAQFLESINATDRDICNFFGIPEHMLNRGKQAYNSNEQKYIEYLVGTLDAYLVPWEQAARINWLSEAEQSNTFLRFVRESLLRMDARARGEALARRIQTGMMNPNEAREKEDLPPYEGGDKFYMQGGTAPIVLPEPAMQPAEET